MIQLMLRIVSIGRLNMESTPLGDTIFVKTPAD